MKADAEGDADEAGALSLFDGGGELGERMREFDWSNNPLGPVSRWPQSLKTCVRIILTSRQPMFVWWGEKLINLYNDAHKSIVGGKHPDALGQPASVVWREIWDQAGPRAQLALRGNQVRYDEALLLIMERHGYQEETYYTFSYSSVPNERGGTGGILCANTDDTQRMIGERRLAVLREIAARTGDARRPEDACTHAAAALAIGQRDVPFALIYLAEPDAPALVLAGATGICPGSPAAPERIQQPADSPWPMAEVLREHRARIVENLSSISTDLPTGAWSQPPARAVVWPLVPPGKTGRAGVLTVALNPFRPFDEDYRGFLSLVAGQISAGISNAQAYEEERRRAEALVEIDRAKTTEAGTARSEPFVQEAPRWIDGAEVAGAPPANEAAAVGSQPSGARVLVVGDNPETREYLTRLLEPHWQIEIATNGEHALQLAQRLHPDLILSDAMMPKLDGFGLLRELRRRPALAETPFILLSARAGDESRVEGLEAGADDHLIKPFAAKELLARVRTLLETARLRRTADTERKRLRMLLGQLPAIVNFLRGPELIIEYAHPMTIKMLGGRELVGRPLLEAIPEFRDQDYPALLRLVLETGEPIEGRDRLVRIADRKGGLRDTYWSFTYLPMRDAQGRVEGVMTFDQEVTEHVLARKKIEEQSAELGRAKREADAARAVAETANRAKDEFLAMLGHELRNPLSPILTALQLMRMRTGDRREQAVIERQVGHLVRLVDDLLDVSRITRGKIELRRQNLEMGEAVAAGLEMARPLLEQRRQKLDLDVPPEGLPLNADPNRLAQVVANLLTNAAKYSDPGAAVHVVARRQSAWVRLAVRDEGVGLPPELLDRVFDVFFQQPQSLDRSKGGLGLGLAIVRSLIEMHGGRVAAHSEGLGKGSEFVVELPVAASAEDLPARAPANLTPSSPGPRPAPQGHRVLVVDDNVDAADTLAELLTDLGHATRATYDAVSALELAGQFEPDVCFLDIGLPVIDGYELAHRLRQTDRGDSLRIIAVTGYGQDTDRRRAREAGFDGHLVKPVSLEALEGVLAAPPGA